MVVASLVEPLLEPALVSHSVVGIQIQVVAVVGHCNMAGKDQTPEDKIVQAIPGSLAWVEPEDIGCGQAAIVLVALS